ncbi:quinolinate synthase NadA [Candidatus Methylacidiphilum fumarolicum]|uniref:Quinolinate synthase n=2 Tax=Candidatus Methylacidiphilum fumarolicum TaxID=591154 RepID=I0K1D0_METFB|nr:quinolinate synthase NadA [Candidatus Methylacidiphilum fumarolicum]MBW6414945.1 quinolinate synthase NadA [Candidatus Methylacidiphilum fumarolicum]TFE70364.1 quinolinate synthase [Candidatus Methylacidiphilum fumarolicum]TFE73956.1 quinolinate synthase NadA [Candidatus Methylacidiphilum fumarolicum]TFE74462.1 quinolinate synthase NadA [Candidatus Methylacidiphilum fumarolicum]TFE77877.1 quinolinate synthase [Candidatus Methylacidiphilum fumarolicum]
MDLREKKEAVLKLKKEKRAIILAHNYQLPEIQEVADYIGDSLGLSFKARDTTAERIVFCGVHFMAETAKILNPNRKVILPDLEAGCSLSDTCSYEELLEYKIKNPEVFVVAYVNTSAAVKSLSDCICTSANAIKIIEKVPLDKKILFVPDQNLGEWVQSKTGRQMDLWPGECYVHVEFTHQSLLNLKKNYPNAPIVAHPECERAVRMLADEVCSTEQMIRYCRNHPANTFIIVTEVGMTTRLKKEIPEKDFIPASTPRCACSQCKFMKKITIDKVISSLERDDPEIDVPEEIRKKAFIPIQQMLEWSE